MDGLVEARYSNRFVAKFDSSSATQDCAERTNENSGHGRYIFFDICFLSQPGKGWFFVTLLNVRWRPHGDSNPGYRRERAVS